MSPDDLANGSVTELAPTSDQIQTVQTPISATPTVVYGVPSPSRMGVLLLHGGGFVDGDPSTVRDLARQWVERYGVTVVTPPYTLATQTPFPAAANDAHTALMWASKHVNARGWIIAGIRAGGNLAAVGAMLARDRGGPRLYGQILIGAMLDASLTTASARQYFECPHGTDNASSACAKCYDVYLPNAADRLHPYASPLLATRLTRLPAAVVITTQTDPLRDESVEYVRRLQQQQVPARLIMTHDISPVEALQSAEAQQSLDRFFFTVTPNVLVV